MRNTAATMRAVAALVWCAFCAWWAYGRGMQIPLLAHVDLGFHELGHLVFYVAPISQLVTAAAGSALQLAVPIGLAVYFGWWRSDRVAASVCCAWAATSARDISVYIADAPYERLPLIGGEHDWAYILGPSQLDRLDQASRYGELTRGFGLILVIAAFTLAGDALTRTRHRRAHPRDVPITVVDTETDAAQATSGEAPSAWPAPLVGRARSEAALTHDDRDRLALDRSQPRPL